MNVLPIFHGRSIHTTHRDAFVALWSNFCLHPTPLISRYTLHGLGQSQYNRAVVYFEQFLGCVIPWSVDSRKQRYIIFPQPKKCRYHHLIAKTLYRFLISMALTPFLHRRGDTTQCCLDLLFIAFALLLVVILPLFKGASICNCSSSVRRVQLVSLIY